MGQAKNRGTRDERVAQAQIRANAEQLGARLIAARRRNLIAAALGIPQTAGAALAKAIDTVGTSDYQPGTQERPINHDSNNA